MCVFTVTQPVDNATVVAYGSRMKYPTRIRSFRFDERVFSALNEVARIEGTNPNKIAQSVLKGWLAGWLAERANEKGPHKAAH